MCEKSSDRNQDRTTSLLTIPNILCFIRLIGSPALLGIAWHQDQMLFLWTFLGLFLTDWFDGKLAILLNQKSVYGARLDSYADVSLYASVLLGIGWLKWEIIQQEVVWIALGVSSYFLTCTVGLIKYGRIPSYHTRAAKICWMLAGLAIVSLLMNWPIWLSRLVIIGIIYTNLETVTMTIVLPEWTNDLRTLAAAFRMKRKMDAENETEFHSE
ncbi:CDP-alcohol phosphatidyltransferase family protein [Rubinisphaera italica]|uniref:CDP-alcohol phosphatidyltransferase n=1 Tax=Rubinisphaera italica TaxID=2527969 RepID=A0A5C5XCW5_9PLAN|nr:CDP-alcohol phosphatidyltransferase family protein [Rubinisphaera italica]TWT60604.1 CDP-alcohol phosphatidyltransferase [Rubinisphaera italica]